MPRIDDPGLLAFLEKVWNRLWKYDQVYLARLVNNERTPWALIAYKFNSPLHKREEIPHETIQEYFMKDLMEEEMIDDKGQSSRDDGVLTKLPLSITMENGKSASDVTHNRFFGENLERVFYALKKIMTARMKAWMQIAITAICLCFVSISYARSPMIAHCRSGLLELSGL